MPELTTTIIPLTSVPRKSRRGKYNRIVEAGLVLGRTEALRVDGLKQSETTGLKSALKKASLEGVTRKISDGNYAVFVSRPPAKQEF